MNYAYEEWKFRQHARLSDLDEYGGDYAREEIEWIQKQLYEVTEEDFED